jgi:hypothetical protein
VKAYADKEDLRQKKKPVSGEIWVRIIQGRVKIQRKMWRKIVEEPENVIIHGQHVRIMAMLPNLLEVVDYAANNPGESVTENGERHPSWSR